MSSNPPAITEVARYHYFDTDGDLAYSVVKFEPKSFRPQMPDGTWGLTAPRILYNLPSLLIRQRDAFVWVVEGEKDADRLASVGLVATTSGGSSTWAKTNTRPIHDAPEIVIVPDCNPAGAKFATIVATDLYPHVRNVKILSLPGMNGYDVSDYLDEHDEMDLMKMRSSTPMWMPERKKRRAQNRSARTGRSRRNVVSLTPGLPWGIEDLVWELGRGSRRLSAPTQVVWCPAHDDEGSTPGLSLTVIDDEHTLAFCHSGCTYDAIRLAAAERMA